MIDALRAEVAGEYSVYWSSSTFRSLWDIKWSEGTVSIYAKWEVVNGGAVDILNASPLVKIAHSELLAELVGLVKRVEQHLECADGADALDLTRITRITSVRDSPRQLYSTL